MSKSRGNLVPLREAIDTHGADAVPVVLWPASRSTVDSTGLQPISTAPRSRPPTSRPRYANPSEPGARRSLSVGALAAVVEDVARLIGDGLQAEEAMLRISTWSEALARHPRGRFPGATVWSRSASTGVSAGSRD